MNDPVPVQQARRLAIAPRGGAIGSEVTIGIAGVPPKASIRIAFANLQAYELIHTVESDADGNFTTVVKIPDWALTDHVHYFFANPGGGQPRTFSDGFHVTAADGTAKVEGTMGTDGDGCVELRNADNVIYSLMGDLGAWIPGDHVLVSGTIASGPTCGDGVGIDVQAITPFYDG